MGLSSDVSAELPGRDLPAVDAALAALRPDRDLAELAERVRAELGDYELATLDEQLAALTEGLPELPSWTPPAVTPVAREGAALEAAAALDAEAETEVAAGGEEKTVDAGPAPLDLGRDVAVEGGAHSLSPGSFGDPPSSDSAPALDVGDAAGLAGALEPELVEAPQLDVGTSEAHSPATSGEAPELELDVGEFEDDGEGRLSVDSLLEALDGDVLESSGAPAAAGLEAEPAIAEGAGAEEVAAAQSVGAEELTSAVELEDSAEIIIEESPSSEDEPALVLEFEEAEASPEWQGEASLVDAAMNAAIDAAIATAASEDAAIEAAIALAEATDFADPVEAITPSSPPAPPEPVSTAADPEDGALEAAAPEEVAAPEDSELDALLVDIASVRPPAPEVGAAATPESTMESSLPPEVPSDGPLEFGEVEAEATQMTDGANLLAALAAAEASALAGETPSPASVAPASVAPASVAPASVAPASVAPVAPAAPASVAPASVAPASVAPASVAPASVAPALPVDPLDAAFASGSEVELLELADDDLELVIEDVEDFDEASDATAVLSADDFEAGFVDFDADGASEAADGASEAAVAETPPAAPPSAAPSAPPEAEAGEDDDSDEKKGFFKKLFG